jgi:hypothetical protein
MDGWDVAVSATHDLYANPERVCEVTRRFLNPLHRQTRQHRTGLSEGNRSLTDVPALSEDGTLRLTPQEVALMESFLDAHDRCGFYLVYNAMTDSAEAGLER